MPRVTSCVLLAVGLVLPLATVRAEEPEEGEAVPVPRISEQVEAPARSWVNVRLGASSSSFHPHVCGEVTPLEVLGIEACGNGSGFLHAEPAPEIAHFRGKLRGPAFKHEWLWLEPWAGFGFAELQIAEDGPGFDFLGPGDTGVETAGPEVSGAVRALIPIALGFELITELNVGAAYLPHAPELRVPQSPWQLSAALTVGAGF